MHSSRISSEQKLALVSLLLLPPFMSKTDQSRSDLKIEAERTLETRATGSNANKKKKVCQINRMQHPEKVFLF